MRFGSLKPLFILNAALLGGDSCQPLRRHQRLKKGYTNF